eukprot:TRINITY_DN1545_c0_g1_i1.p1 TRINITY_DN1545_c0_g1~~TRINITY_DN1545_c0_g1_i1.p1  ORF type:complete len:584 (-),score=138.20 TRINITY_DN1545_c0_g1_i1:296-2047(-)
MAPVRALVFLLLSFTLLSLVTADLKTHRYTENEIVTLHVNQVGPYRNPQETYEYYSLPFCKPDELVDVQEGLGAALLGYELIESPIQIHFKRDLSSTSICSKSLTDAEFAKLQYAVRGQYWYQFFLDDLPIWGMVGESVGEGASAKLFVYTHKHFDVAYNIDRVIEVNLTSDKPTLLTPGDELAFTYSVKWTRSDVAYEHRFDKYLDDSFFEHQIHWFSIFNSFMFVIFLSGLVGIIVMRTLRKDYARFARDEEDPEDDHDLTDEYGWKQIHGDVFRSPPYLSAFAALVGTGHQLILLVFCVLFFAAVGNYYRARGTVVTAFIVCYAFTSFVAGYGSGGFYSRHGGKKWIKTALFTACFFPGTLLLIGCILNSVAMSYGSMHIVHILTLVKVVAIWAFVSLPLTFVGTIFGKNWSGQGDFPCRVNKVPRQIPERKAYMEPWVYICLGGLFPFGSIFIEMYFIFTSFWHYKYYYVYGFMLLVYIILIVVSVCVTIVSTYFLLNSEDYRWPWVSFLSSGSTGAYVFLYSIYYYSAKTNMSGLMQMSFYFGYMSILCVGLFVLCGTIGYLGTSVFVRRIYRNVKID